MHRYLRKVLRNSRICAKKFFLGKETILSDVNIINIDTLFALI